MDYEQITRAATRELIRKYELHCCVIGITIAATIVQSIVFGTQNIQRQQIYMKMQSVVLYSIVLYCIFLCGMAV